MKKREEMGKKNGVKVKVVKRNGLKFNNPHFPRLEIPCRYLSLCGT